MTAAATVTDRLQVLAAGIVTTIQDAGRPGWAHLGVPPSGALDQPAYRLANRLVGNDAGAAVLETTFTGPTLLLRSSGVRWVALTGAPAPLRVNGRPAALYQPVPVRPGHIVEIGTAPAGLRSYLAISGGIAGEPVLASLSTDLLSGLGPPVLTDGVTIPLGQGTGVRPTAGGVVPATAPSREVVLQLVLGPRADWFEAESVASLLSSAWSVSGAVNRVGVRLDGPALRRRRLEELPPEGLVTGSIQVPTAGRPLIFLNDHPVTGGYPVVGVLRDRSLAAAAQLRPGATVRFSTRLDPAIPAFGC